MKWFPFCLYRVWTGEATMYQSCCIDRQTDGRAGWTDGGSTDRRLDG